MAFEALLGLPEVALDGDFFEASEAERQARQRVYRAATAAEDDEFARRAQALLEDVESGQPDLGPTFGHEEFDAEIAAWLSDNC